MNIRDIVDLANSYQYRDEDFYDDDLELEEEPSLKERFQRSFMDATNQYREQDNEDQGSGAGYDGGQV